MVQVDNNDLWCWLSSRQSCVSDDYRVTQTVGGATADQSQPHTKTEPTDITADRKQMVPGHTDEKHHLHPAHTPSAAISTTKSQQPTPVDRVPH